MPYIKKIIFLIASMMFISGCIKMPEEFQSPSLKIDIIIDKNTELFSLKFSAGVKNENSDVAFLRFKGKVKFVEGKESGGFISKIIRILTSGNNKPVMELPFEIPEILPFGIGIIDIEKKFKEEEIMPLVDLLDINREEMVKNKGIEGLYVNEKNIELQVDSYDKECIISLLQGKINEKN